MHVTNALVSRSNELCEDVRQLYKVASALDVTLEAEWSPTAQNVWADWLSREQDSTDWRLAPHFFKLLDSMYGPHDVNRYSTFTSKHLPRYN